MSNNMTPFSAALGRSLRQAAESDVLAAKAANKMEDMAWKVSDTLSDKFEEF